jgi:hypothetical protein
MGWEGMVHNTHGGRDGVNAMGQERKGWDGMGWDKNGRDRMGQDRI